jgi:UDP:flavonoid glycosyltransferase YjiC (YdhE family)
VKKTEGKEIIILSILTFTFAPKLLQNEKNSAIKQKPLILFSPLDWGWGHTTRCIPLIRSFQDLGCEILVACNSTQKKIIESEIYGARYLFLEGYNIEYGRSGWLTRFKIFAQLYKILMKINQERRWLRELLDKEPVKAIVSDNRYGLCHSRIPSIFITHQLQPKTGLGTAADAMVRSYLFRFINRFTQCWVPDSREDGLAGTLSHPPKFPVIPVNYIGLVSRVEQANSQADQVFGLLVLLSGPEPQRSVFEKLVLDQLNDSHSSTLSCVVVRGVDAGASLPSNVPPNVRVYNVANAEKLSQLIANAQTVLCRSGYTSLMELISRGKKMILVPTPGQTEQEYLAKYFVEKNYAIAFSQVDFSLTTALNMISKKNLTTPVLNSHLYKHAVTAFYENLTA